MGEERWIEVTFKWRRAGEHWGGEARGRVLNGIVVVGKVEITVKEEGW